MKNLKNKFMLLMFLVTSGLFLNSCSDYFDLNDNPNLVTDQPINTFLTTVTHKTGLNNQRFAGFITYYTQYLASPTAASATDIYEVSDNSTSWNNAFYALADIYDFKSVATETENAMYHVGVANVLMVYHLALINDTWGSAPFSQAFAQNNVLNPAFDSDEELYNTCTTLIDEAIDQLSMTDQADLGPEDLIYAGDHEKWLKLAYALKARLGIKISKKSSYSPETVLEAIDNSFTSIDDDAGMSVFNGNQPWAQIAISNADNLLGGWLSSNFVNHLNGETYGVFDPRIEKITDMTVNNNYVGTRNGAGNVGGANTIKDECYISVNSPLTGIESPIYIVTYSEVKFIEAEAALASGNRSRAYSAYLEGIESSMDRLEVDDEKANAYLASSSVAVGAANLTRKLILKEKYVTTYLNPEAWNDMRRCDYDYEGFQLPVNAVLDQPIRQAAYPEDEVQRNGANVPEQGSLADRLWFDQP